MGLRATAVTRAEPPGLTPGLPPRTVAIVTTDVRDTVQQTLEAQSLPGTHPVAVTIRRIIRHRRDAERTADEIRPTTLLSRTREYETYAGLQPGLGREVVLKRAVDPSNTAAVDALLSEARICGSLEHPNILSVHAIEEGQGGPWVLSRRAPGVSWLQLLLEADDLLEPAVLLRNLRILVGVCRALEYAHSRGVAHLGVRPAQVVVGSYGEVVLVDWGRAEHRKGLALASGIRTDVGLLGDLVHEVLTGSPREESPELPVSTPDALRELCASTRTDGPAEPMGTAQAFREAIETHIGRATSRRTTQLGVERLARLHEAAASQPIDPVRAQLEVQRAYAECRGAFDAALSDWTENPEALSGRSLAMYVLFDFELRSGSLGRAGAVLDELRATSGPAGLPDLEARLDAERSRRERRAVAPVALGALAEMRRFRGTDLTRSYALILHSAAVAALLVGWSAMLRASLVSFSHGVAAALALVTAGGTLVITYFLSPKLRDTEAFRAAADTILALCVPIAAFHLYASGRGIGLGTAAAVDATISLGVMVANSLVVSRAFIGPAALALLSLAAVTVIPEFALEVLGLGYLGTGLALAWYVRPAAS